MVNIFGKTTKTDKDSTRSSKEGSVILSDDEKPCTKPQKWSYKDSSE